MLIGNALTREPCTGARSGEIKSRATAGAELADPVASGLVARLTAPHFGTSGDQKFFVCELPQIRQTAFSAREAGVDASVASANNILADQSKTNVFQFPVDLGADLHREPGLHRHRCRASRRLVLRTKSFPSRCDPSRDNLRFATVEANSYRAEKLDIFAQTLVTQAKLGVRTRIQRCTSGMR